MTEEFNKHIEEFNLKSKILLETKGKDYTRNGEDRLRNFRDGEDIGVPPLKHCFLLARKQFNAIHSYIMGYGESEPIEQRLFDLSNFCKLMYCLIKELEGAKCTPSKTELSTRDKAIKEAYGNLLSFSNSVKN